MTYYFAVETTESTFEALNIKKSEAFKRLSGSNGVYECTLEEIDMFTSQYLNQSNLANHLICDKILPDFRYNNPLSVIYVNGGEIRKVQGNLLFKDSKKFIDNPNLAIEYIINKAKEQDSNFFRKLSLILPENCITTYMISVLATAIEDKTIKEKGHLIDKLKMLLNRKSNEDLIDNIAKSLVQFCYIDGDGKLIFADTIDYEKFHYTVSFISEYEKEYGKTKTEGPKKTKKKNTLNK